MSRVLIFTLIFTYSVAAFAGEKPKQKLLNNYIALFDLETQDVDKKISRPLTESIRRELVTSGKYEVIDRGNMNKILGEQAFQMTGCVAQECVVEAGQLLGVGKIITGSVSIVGRTYYLSLSLINVQTGKIEKVSEDTCKCEVDDLIDSSKTLVRRLLEDASIEQQRKLSTNNMTTDHSNPKNIRNDDIKNVALGKPTVQSSTYPHRCNPMANKAVDGSRDGFYDRSCSITQTDRGDFNPWWQVDLQSTHNLQRIVIWNRTDDCCLDFLKNFYVSVSQDGNTWETLYTEPGIVGEKTIIPANCSARFVRIQLRNSEYLMLAEVEIWATNTR